MLFVQGHIPFPGWLSAPPRGVQTLHGQGAKHQRMATVQQPAVIARFKMLEAFLATIGDGESV
jgi:hypothetical protein